MRGLLRDAQMTFVDDLQTRRIFLSTLLNSIVSLSFVAGVAPWTSDKIGLRSRNLLDCGQQQQFVEFQLCNGKLFLRAK